jgi:tRNA nucleotidyltransferase (CCA-adding enzyme)
MSRYGYEGYPVVQDGKIVGLLTRRAVDRAMSHNYTKPVSSLMETGSYSVSPADSLEHLQRLVAETGWGQMPVVDPNSAAVIGIVTRTDLLKNLAPGPKPTSKLSLVSKLESALPADRLALLKIIAAAAREQHAALYVVGGFVRDLILERPSLDFDLVVEGDAIALARWLARRYGGRVTGHARFGTAKWRLDDRSEGASQDKISVAGLQSVDLVSARTEFYTHPSALPTVERGSIKLDLHRRDFTINTLALRLDGTHYGELHDYWGGLDDLRTGLVRVLHSLSFVDDPTRMLRAVRFEQRFAFRIEQRTMQLLLEARSLIERLSGDRIRHELNHILDIAFAPQILSRLHSLGLLAAIHPALGWDDWLYSHIEALQELEVGPEWGVASDLQNLRRNLGYMLWLIQLTPQQADMVTKRLKLPAQLAIGIRATCALWQDRQQLAHSSAGQAVARLEDVPALARFALNCATSDTQLKQILHAYITEWQYIHPTIDGHALRELGVAPGPVYKRLLGELRTACLDGRVSTPDQELAFLQELLVSEKNMSDDQR